MPNERISMSKLKQLIGLQASNLSVRAQARAVGLSIGAVSKLTPTQRASRAVTKARSAVKVPAVTASAATSFVEIILGDERRIRPHGEAQRAVLARVLAWLPER